MQSACVLLRTSTRDSFTYQNGYRDVTTSELETLIVLAQETIQSLQKELDTRQAPTEHQTSTSIMECTKRLQDSMESMKILGRLDAKRTKLAASAAAVLKTETNNREGRIYQTFLRDIHRQCGPEQVVLCAAGLGKQRIVCLNNKERTLLVQYVKNRAVVFASPVLLAVAKECQILEKDGIKSFPYMSMTV